MSAPPEAGLVAGALSLDGRTFHLEGPVDSPWVPGDLLVLSTRQGGQICAQLLSKDQSSAGKAGGLGGRHVRSEMLDATPYFRQGECLMAGTFIPAPTFVQMGTRRTREGGSDVRIPLPAVAGAGDPS